LGKKIISKEFLMYTIGIKTKDEFKDVRGKKIFDDIISIGINGIKKVTYCPMYIIDGDIELAEIYKIAKELLSDKITEDFFIEVDGTAQKKDLDGDGSIEVWYKKGVADPAAESVAKAVLDLGIEKKITVKTGSKYFLFGEFSDEKLLNIAEKLLANTLIQGYKIENYNKG
jgi:phosphoribosylformylglycinamidine (FGAM) synthase PurS component